MSFKEFGKFELLPHNYDEYDNCFRIRVENVNRDSDHWLTLRNRKGEIIGQVKMEMINKKFQVFEITDLRQANVPIL